MILMRIEPARSDDVAEIAAIYAHHVIHGTASFEAEPPDVAEMAARFAKCEAAGWPWLVARGDAGEVLGYAYATHDRRGEGIGRALMALLIVEAERAGFRQMIAVIGGAQPASVRLHAACGFREAGRMRSVGRKHGEWLDTLYMQRALGEGDSTPPAQEPA
jgi:L-amino acid N-acyltransferase YncA